MKAKQIRELSPQEREQKIRDLREELFKLRFQGATGQLEKPTRIGQLKRDLARIMTIEKEEAQ